MNDTHPALAVAELMRILLDQAKLPWDQAWDITLRTLAYTNHTLLPEALERWPVELFEVLIPRHLEIVYEINRRFLDDVRRLYPGDEARVQRMSLIEEGPARKVRMAHLAVVGSHSTNGVAAIHSELLRTRVLSDFAEMFPARFNNKTNGVTPRRWLQQANPFLIPAHHPGRSARNGSPTWRNFATSCRWPRTRASASNSATPSARPRWRSPTGSRPPRARSSIPTRSLTARSNAFTNTSANCSTSCTSSFCTTGCGTTPSRSMTPHTFFFAGKAAPAYHLAKLIIKLINNVAGTINGDPVVRGRLKVLFLPEYNVSMAERLIPASDVSEQISTAGFEASGTGNMKFMMNGALTIGTRDGATIEMAEEAGEENFFLFGLTAQQVADSAGWYDPHWHYTNEPETRAALDLIFSDHFSRHEPGVFGPIRDTLLTNGDRFRHLADLTDYARAHRELAALYADPEAWARKAIINVACSGKFSSDRTITEYANEIWNLKPSPVQ